MDNFEDTVGFITGGAAGIGLGVAKALGQRGMTVVLADVEQNTLAQAANDLESVGIRVETEVLNVADADAYAEVAERVFSRHGKLNFLFNNAGVACPSPATGTNFDDWRWVVDVNLMGVVYGVELFLQRMLDSGEPGYIINTASLAGHIASPQLLSYTATKFAVVGYTEGLQAALAESPIGVSLLAPAWVKTGIAHSVRNHPSETMAAKGNEENPLSKLIDEQGISVDEVAERVLECMASETLHIFTHPEFWTFIDERMARIRGDHAQIL
ncbi:MAG: SDR family NAD(P)-dependent oxidoreductase [Pseudomonadota bacterium]